MTVVGRCFPDTLRRWASLLPTLVLGVVASGCDRPLLTARPSIVLITVDTLRPDRIAAYGHATNKTPAMDRLAAEGMLFEHAYCDMPWTTGSMSSVMTGHYSSSHGVDLPDKRLKPEAVTMAEILRDRGYRTAAIIGSFPLDSVFGLDQGFETYDDQFSTPIFRDPATDDAVIPTREPLAQDGGTGNRELKDYSYRPDEDVTAAAIRWLDAFDREREGWPLWPTALDRWFGPRFFLWVHYFGPHEKLRLDLGFVAQEPEIVAAYDSDVEKVDVAVGRLVESLRKRGALDDTLVIVHSDHGQNLGEFGFVGHGVRIDEATTRIPLILRYPSRIPPGLRREDAANNVDILPTVLELVGAEAPGLRGRSLLPSQEDPRGVKVPVGQQTAYFSTKMTTLFRQPLPTPYHGLVLGKLDRSGLRTPEWRFVEDQVLGDCEFGGDASRDPMGEWTMRDGKPLGAGDCEKIRGAFLYPATPKPDEEPNVGSRHLDVVQALRESLRSHASVVNPLGASFELTPQHEEKLRSLGYLK